jgi:hypothetical protein
MNLNEFFTDNSDKIDYDNLPKIPMNYKHASLGFGQNTIGKFRKELLMLGITDTFKACEMGLRTATTRKEKYTKDTYIMITCTDYDYCLLAIITKSSYKVSTISAEKWSELEGWTPDHFNTNPDVLNKYQFQFKVLQKITI